MTWVLALFEVIVLTSDVLPGRQATLEDSVKQPRIALFDSPRSLRQLIQQRCVLREPCFSPSTVWASQPDPRLQTPRDAYRQKDQQDTPNAPTSPPHLADPNNKPKTAYTPRKEPNRPHSAPAPPLYPPHPTNPPLTHDQRTASATPTNSRPTSPSPPPPAAPSSLSGPPPGAPPATKSPRSSGA